MGDAENPDNEATNPGSKPSPQAPAVSLDDKSVLAATEAQKGNDEVTETNELISQLMRQNGETKTIEWLQFSVNAGLAVIGIIAIYIYYGQLQVMKGQLGEIVKQYPEIQKQAKAAVDSVAEIQRQTRLDERPWLKIEFMGDGTPGPDPSASNYITSTAGKPLITPVRITNVGKTPAFSVEGFIVVEIVPTGKEPNIPDPENSSSCRRSCKRN